MGIIRGVIRHDMSNTMDKLQDAVRAGDDDIFESLQITHQDIEEFAVNRSGVALAA